MTSKPASRRARATTLAPRSWPSRPGLATRMRSLRAEGAAADIGERALLTSEGRVKGRTLSTAPMIRPARPDDVPVLLSLIRALARYEKLEHEVVGTEADLRAHLFGTPARAEALLVEDEGQAVAFAL